MTAARASNWHLLKQCFALQPSVKVLTTPKKGFASFDGLRALGMIMVIATHTITISGAFQANTIGISQLTILDNTPKFISWILNSTYMIDMFFILSGFLIASILYREYEREGHINIKRFYYRRFMRLMPTYVFVALVMFMVGVPNSDKLWQNLLYINNFFPYRETALPWTWSLAVEEQFYLLFPLFVSTLLAFKKRYVGALFILFALSFVIRLWLMWRTPELWNSPMHEQIHDPQLANLYLSVIYDNLYTRYGAFLCGIYAAYLYTHNKEQCRRYFKTSPSAVCVTWTCYLVVAVIMFVSWHQTHDFEQWFVIAFQVCSRNLFAVAFAILMLVVILDGRFSKWPKKVLEHKIWYPLAQLTYSAYLIHLPFVAGFTFLFLKLDYSFINAANEPYLWMLAVVFLASTLVTFLSSALIFLFLEHPLMQWRDIKSGKSFRQSVARH